MNRISLSVVSLVLIWNNNGKLYTGFLYIRKRTVPFVHEFTATDQRERITRGCCAAVAFTTKTFARSFRDKRETKWYFPADMRYEKNFAVHAYKYINVYMYIYTSMHEVRIIVAISVWLVLQTTTIKSDIASAGVCSNDRPSTFARRFFLYVAWWSVARLLTLRERVAIVCRTGPLVSFLRSGSSCNTNVRIFILLIDLQFYNNTTIWKLEISLIFIAHSYSRWW